MVFGEYFEYQKIIDEIRDLQKILNRLRKIFEKKFVKA